MKWLVLLLWWFLIYENGVTVRWGGFSTQAECQALLQKVVSDRQTSGCLTEPAISKADQGPIAGQTS
jgi:hypothetical protein